MLLVQSSSINYTNDRLCYTNSIVDRLLIILLVQIASSIEYRLYYQYSQQNYTILIASSIDYRLYYQNSQNNYTIRIASSTMLLVQSNAIDYTNDRLCYQYSRKTIDFNNDRIYYTYSIVDILSTILLVLIVSSIDYRLYYQYSHLQSIVNITILY